ncbi:protein of unknown function [Hyphomicrobium sp. MC1]|nr:protein of unknown function [Hyphomicrobium sp. MC1]
MGGLSGSPVEIDVRAGLKAMAARMVLKPGALKSGRNLQTSDRGFNGPRTLAAGRNSDISPQPFAHAA